MDHIETESVHYKNFAAQLLFNTITSLIAQLQMNVGPVYSKKKKKDKKKQIRSYTAMYICSSFLKLTSINMFVQKAHLSKLKEG